MTVFTPVGFTISLDVNSSLSGLFLFCHGIEGLFLLFLSMGQGV